MKFIVNKIDSSSRSSNSRTRETCIYLEQSDWDDYGFRTGFIVRFFNSKGEQYTIGVLKLAKSNQEHGYTEIPDTFERLGPKYYSLGLEQGYYETLISTLTEEERSEYLTSVRDCAYDREIWEQYRSEKAMKHSLLRDVTHSQVEGSFRNILEGNPAPTPFNFSYQEKDPGSPLLEIEVTPDSLPPTNIHVLIGRNGVGKTRLFSSLSRNFIDDQSSEHIEKTPSKEIVNLVVVSFSAFDKFKPPQGNNRSGIRYDYVGLKKYHSEDEKEPPLKTSGDLRDDFLKSLKACLNEPRRSRWLKMVTYLESDPGLAEINLKGKLPKEEDKKLIGNFGENFDELSSGHKIVLLTITKLVELVNEKTLVLIDEPECHLHTPLLGSLIRAISDLLVKRNGLAILATHSPVVLQEVPKSCVTFLRRVGNTTLASRPDRETFAENIGILTHEIFGLEITESGYYNLLKEHCREKTCRQVFGEFGSGYEPAIGSSGQAIVQALTSKKEPEQ